MTATDEVFVKMAFVSAKTILLVWIVESSAARTAVRTMGFAWLITPATVTLVGLVTPVTSSLALATAPALASARRVFACVLKVDQELTVLSWCVLSPVTAMVSVSLVSASVSLDSLVRIVEPRSAPISALGRASVVMERLANAILDSLERTAASACA